MCLQMSSKVYLSFWDTDLGSIWLEFLKTVFCSKNQEEQVKHGEHIWFPILCSKNIESTKN